MRSRLWKFGLYEDKSYSVLPSGADYLLYAHRHIGDELVTVGLIHFKQPVTLSGLSRALQCDSVEL